MTKKKKVRGHSTLKESLDFLFSSYHEDMSAKGFGHPITFQMISALKHFLNPFLKFALI